MPSPKALLLIPVARSAVRTPPSRRLLSSLLCLVGIRVPEAAGAQFDGVYQNMPPFHSPYQGVNSLSFKNGEGQDTTSTYGVYLGSQLAEESAALCRC